MGDGRDGDGTSRGSQLWEMQGGQVQGGQVQGGQVQGRQVQGGQGHFDFGKVDDPTGLQVRG